MATKQGIYASNVVAASIRAATAADNCARDFLSCFHRIYFFFFIPLTYFGGGGGRVSVDGEGLVLLFSLWFRSPAVSIGRGAPFLLLSVRPRRVPSRPVAVAVASDVLRADCEAGGVF